MTYTFHRDNDSKRNIDDEGGECLPTMDKFNKKS